jgi:tetratricopeptide (TPR) repeat protein
MFKQVPVQVWLLLAIMAAGYAPARYIYEYIAKAPSRRDITRPPEDLTWRTSALLARNLAFLGALAALAVFIFTPAATQFAHSPAFWPILAAAGGVFALFTVVRALSLGQIQPLARGFNNTYERDSQPKRFWASMAWNSFFGCLCLWLAFKMIEQAPIQALEDQCYDTKNIYSPQDGVAACNKLIAKRAKGDTGVANLLAARGSAYFRLGDYRRATTDYTEAVRLDPNDSSSYYNTGLIDEQLGDRGLAIDSFSSAIQADAENADAYSHRGSVYLDLGKFDKAAADFTKAHGLRLDDFRSVALRGIAYASKGDQLRARQDFAAVRAIDPTNLIIMRGEAILAIGSGNLNAAVNDLSQLLAQNPKDRWSRAARAEAYRRLGKYDEMHADSDELKRLSGESRVGG